MNRNRKLTLLGLALAVLVATVIAAVPGFFQQVDSTNGYTVNGGVGSSGQALCSNGAFYAVPCNVVGTVYNQTIALSGTSYPQQSVFNLLPGVGMGIMCLNAFPLTGATNCTFNSSPAATQTAGLISSDGTSGSRQFDQVSTPFATAPVSPYIYQNTTSVPLYVTVSADGGGGGFGGAVYCDSSASPTTIVGKFGRVNDGSSNPNYYPASVTFIVPPNYYYGITVTSAGGTPVGSNAQDSWTEWAVN